MKKDFGEYLSWLGTEKFRSIIIHHTGSKVLNQFAQQAANRFDGIYFDVLDHFKNDQELAKQIDTFGVEELKLLLKEKSKGQYLLIVDRIDFLLDTWQKKEKEAFYRLIKNQWNSFIKGMEAIVVFCIINNDDLEDLKILDTRENSRVHPLSIFKNIS